MTDQVQSEFLLARPKVLIEDFVQDGSGVFFDTSMDIPECTESQIYSSPICVKVPFQMDVCSPVKIARAPRTPPSVVLPTFKDRVDAYRQQLLFDEVAKTLFDMGLVEAEPKKRDSDVYIVSKGGKRMKLWE